MALLFLFLCESNECVNRSVHFLHLVLVTDGSLLAVEKGLAVLVQTKVGNGAVAGVLCSSGAVSQEIDEDSFVEEAEDEVEEEEEVEDANEDAGLEEEEEQDENEDEDDEQVEDE